MKTVHLVYPHGSRVSCPDAIGRNLAIRLRERYHVNLYEWHDRRVIVPGSDDVLLGHPHPYPWTCFRRSLKQPGWQRILIMSPYTHGMDGQVAFIDPLIPLSDRYLAITGNYWFSTVGSSSFAHWLPKMVHLDLAVDRNDFPRVKTRFNPPGRRSFVYIGNSLFYKNVGYLSQIAELMKGESEIAWIGQEGPGIPGLKRLGFLDFNSAHAKEVISQFDFLLTVGNADANPTTIIEAMAWGLIPVCTPQSGYSGYSSIVNVPLNEAPGAVAVLRDLQRRPNQELEGLQQKNWDLLDSHFNWDRFSQQVIGAIERADSPDLGHESWQRKWALRWAAASSPHSYLRPDRAARFIKKKLSHLAYTVR
jgi:glycosyltransferase involved in cell wall biosynthesis